MAATAMPASGRSKRTARPADDEPLAPEPEPEPEAEVGAPTGAVSVVVGAVPAADVALW